MSPSARAEAQLPPPGPELADLIARVRADVAQLASVTEPTGVLAALLEEHWPTRYVVGAPSPDVDLVELLKADPGAVWALPDEPPGPKLRIRVLAEPKPQGSFAAVLIRGRAQLIQDNKGTKPWRAAVVEAAKNAITAAGGWIPPSEAVGVSCEFILERPRTVQRALPFVRPDLDKYLRSTFDALTDAEVWTDDCQVTDLLEPTRKRYARPGQPPGAIITVRDLTGTLF